MPAGGGGRAKKICNQIPCPRANHSSQIQPNFPTPGCTLAAKKGTIKISPNKTLQSFINGTA